MTATPSGPKDSSKRQRRTRRIPHFDSVEEAAAFWDTHDSAEFGGEFEEVGDVRFVLVRGKADRRLTVRLDEPTLAIIAEQARELGVGAPSLVRLWIFERVHAERKRRAAKTTVGG